MGFREEFCSTSRFMVSPVREWGPECLEEAVQRNNLHFCSGFSFMGVSFFVSNVWSLTPLLYELISKVGP